MPKPERTAAILVAAGRGLRAGAGGPKQYRSIGGQTFIFRAMAPFCRHPQVFAVQPVLNPDDAAMFNDAVGSRCSVTTSIFNSAVGIQPYSITNITVAVHAHPASIITHTQP